MLKITIEVTARPTPPGWRAMRLATPPSGERIAEYRLAPTSREDMEAVWLYSLMEWGAEQTERYIEGLTGAFALLTDNFGTGAPCNEIREGYRRYPVKRHMIYSRRTACGIEVIRGLHDRMLTSRHF